MSDYFHGSHTRLERHISRPAEENVVMRERSGARTEYATRRLVVPATVVSLVVGLALVATPSSAVPARPPTDTGGAAGPATTPRG